MFIACYCVDNDYIDYMKAIITVSKNGKLKQLGVFGQSSLDDSARIALELLDADFVRRAENLSYKAKKSTGKGNLCRW